MRLIKLLVNFFLKNNFFKHLRIIFNIKPVYIDTSFLEKNASVSDSFPWRCDDGYKTIFRFTDLLKFFYKIKNSKITIILYSRNGDIIKKISLKNINISSSLIIDQNFINDSKHTYGTFCIFHGIENESEMKEMDLIVRNSCYLGFTKNDFSSKIVKFYLNKKKYLLKENSSIIINIGNQSFVSIISNCYFLRPIIFNYKNNYFDVHHG